MGVYIKQEKKELKKIVTARSANGHVMSSFSIHHVFFSPFSTRNVPLGSSVSLFASAVPPILPSPVVISRSTGEAEVEAARAEGGGTNEV